MKQRLVPLLLLLCALSNAQSFLNLNFEQTTGILPTGWSFGGGNFTYEVDTTTNYNITAHRVCASVRSHPTHPNSGPPASGYPRGRPLDRLFT